MIRLGNVAAPAS